MGIKRRIGENSLKLPDDLIMHIISRVPEKDLMRLTCVSKSWCSLINTDSYLSQLRSHLTALLNRPFFIVQRREGTVSDRDYLFYNYWFETDSIEDENPKLKEIHNPFDDEDDFPRRHDACVIDSCDGLLVLQRRPSLNMALSCVTSKKHKVVPPNPAGDDNVVFCGFGYDHVHGCYKLVTKIEHASSEDCAVDFMIYNVTNCTWKKSRIDAIEDDDLYSQPSYGRICVDGALYWGVYDCIEMTKILRFDLSEEEFHEVDPPHFDEGMLQDLVTVFDGRLCFVCKAPSDERFEFWLMERGSKRQSGSSYSERWMKFWENF